MPLTKSALAKMRLFFTMMVILLGASVVFGERQGTTRETRFFRIDPAAKRIVGPAAHVDNFLGLRLVAVTVDQPQYWPHEVVRVKVIIPGWPRSMVTLNLRKRDANPITVGPRALDENGVLVLEALNGKKRRLELGEYRVEAVTADKKIRGSATFSVVEGSLGAVSLAYEFKKLTQPAELERVKAGWFLGNAAGAGKRWGNGLSFKNQLRVNNQPYNGPATFISRCMLPGCNGVVAGPQIKTTVKGGLIFGTLQVGGHSGPFQLEVVTPKGSLRHQFEGSSHVERDMVLVAKGVGHVFRAGLAPYAGTTQVPGRQIFIEHKAGNAKDAFEVQQIVARGGQLAVKLRRSLSSVTLHVWTPQPDGRFKQRTMIAGARKNAGTMLTATVEEPFSLVTMGGFSGGTFVEGFVVAFTPAGLRVALDTPPAGAPLREVPVMISVKDLAGRGIKVSGILEVFDNRVAAQNPTAPLSSAVGDGVRNVANSLNAWVDPLELEKRRRRYEKEAASKVGRIMSTKGAMARPQPRPSVSPRAPRRMAKRISAMGLAGVMGGSGVRSGGRSQVPEVEAAEGEAIRQGQQKVVFCDQVATDASGQAQVTVKLPPQTGRVVVRFSAFKGLDFSSEQKSMDVAKRAYVEASLPNAFVPGARLDLELSAVNTTKEPVVLQVSGAGIAAPLKQTIPPGTKEIHVPWQGQQQGTIVVQLSSRQGKLIDRREMMIRDVVRQRITLSRLELGGGSPITLDQGESAVVYEGPGQLLKGTVMNMVTTMYSWFGHAEALSAKVAVSAQILAAIHSGLLDDDGLEQTLRVDLDKAVRDLRERFVDRQSGLVRPYPGLAPNPLWSAWTARNLYSALHALRGQAKLAAKLRDALKTSSSIVAGVKRALKGRKLSAVEMAYYDPEANGRELIPVEINGKVVYRILTDDAVVRFAVQKILPLIDDKQQSCELAFAKAYDTFRFLRAFQRTGSLQYMTELAKSLWLAGPRRRQEFNRIFAIIARGMINTQEPGLIQGPALLGGVYSSPMALVRFLELLLLTGKGRAARGTATFTASGQSQRLAYGQLVKAAKPSSVVAPVGAVVRIDRAAQVTLDENYGKPFGDVRISRSSLKIGQSATLVVKLDAAKDPLEYYAIVAVPTTTAVKQTEDILSDYKGQLIYGQQAMGAAKMQALAVPFRGSRTLKLLLEGIYPGTSDGLVAIRHLSNPTDVCTLRLKAVTVQ